jgi:nucleotide-binding universal stress UspA family protein
VKRILVPLDGTQLSEAIFPLATDLARGHRAELLLVRVLGPQESPEADAAARREADAWLAPIAAGLALQVPTRWEVCQGVPDRAIAAVARDRGADLVAMSTHGRGSVTASVAERVVQQAPVPVLVVHGPFAWPRGHVGTVVVPLDGSALSASILPLVAQVAGPFDFAIELLRAVEPVPECAPVEIPAAGRKEMRQRETAEAEGYLAGVAEPLEARGLRVTRSIAHGPADVAIVRHAGDVGAGLIAMSTHGRTGLGRRLLGSVAERVLRAAPVPVLLAKAPVEGPATGR